jgi:hypothetical protein
MSVGASCEIYTSPILDLQDFVVDPSKPLKRFPTPVHDESVLYWYAVQETGIWKTTSPIHAFGCLLQVSEARRSHRLQLHFNL